MQERLQPHSINQPTPHPLDRKEVRADAQRLCGAIFDDVPEKGLMGGYDGGVKITIQERVTELSQILNHLEKLAASFGYLNEDQRQGILARAKTLEREAGFLAGKADISHHLTQLQNIKIELSQKTGVVWH